MKQKKVETPENIAIVKCIVSRMRQPTARDRVELAKQGLALLKQVEPVNGTQKKVLRTANRLASALEREYEKPEKRIEAATVATEIRSFAMGMKPMVDTLCLS